MHRGDDVGNQLPAVLFCIWNAVELRFPIKISSKNSLLEPLDSTQRHVIFLFHLFFVNFFRTLHTHTHHKRISAIKTLKTIKINNKEPPNKYRVNYIVSIMIFFFLLLLSSIKFISISIPLVLLLFWHSLLLLLLSSSRIGFTEVSLSLRQRQKTLY